MGNALGCVSRDGDNEFPKRSWKCTLYSLPFSTSFSGRPGFLRSVPSLRKKERNKERKRRQRFGVDEDSMISEQALAAAAFLFHSQQSNSSVPFIRSTSVIHPSSGSRKQNFKRSSSARQQSNNDTLLRPQQLVNQELKIGSLQTNHFVLVHGGGFGAWCWYKTMALLEESGFKVDAVDLTGSGVSSFDTNNITSLAQYVKPLTDILHNLGNEQKVILVGHDFGGVCISFVMELFPSKIAKAVFIAAAMLGSGQNTLDMFSQQMGSNDLMRQAENFLYANGKDNPPTSIDLDRTVFGDLLFNQSSAKDVALASVSMRPIPFAPVLEKLSLSEEKYGSIRRFYIKTLEDFAIPVSVQEAMISSNPPEQVFHLKGSDHAPFFSRPQALHRTLVEISKIPPKQD